MLSATAPNRGICCRCGEGAGNQAGKPDRQKPTEQTETGKKRKQSRQGRPDRKQPPGYFTRLFKVLRGAENGVDRPVDAHAVGIDHQVIFADVGPLAAGVAAVVVGTAGIDPLAASSSEILNREATRTAAESGPEVTKTRRTCGLSRRIQLPRRPMMTHGP